MNSDIWKAILEVIIRYHYLFIIGIIVILSVTELPHKIVYSIIPHRLIIEYKLFYEDQTIENRLHYRIYGDYTEEDIVRLIFRRTPDHYIDELVSMTYSIRERII